MEWEPNQRDAWASDAQRWISQINGVLQCKIDLDDSGEVTGVHVVAGMERDPRHIVRDVEGLLKARLDLDVYYKKIGVVQVLDNGRPGSAAVASEASDASDAEPAPVAEPVASVPESDPAADPVPAPIPAILVAEDLGVRVVCSGVGVMSSETTVRAEVQLRAGDVEAVGRREGANHAGSDLILVAGAAVEAVAELISDPVILHLREARTEHVGEQDVVLVAVDLVEGRRSVTLFGTRSTGHNRQQAAVFAVLDALNRRLALHGLKSLEAEA